MIASGYRFGLGSGRCRPRVGGANRQLDVPRLHRCIELYAQTEMKVDVGSPHAMHNLTASASTELDNDKLDNDMPVDMELTHLESSDDKEALRRKRISVAMTGKVPWNLGKKHSAETIAKIREKSMEAMKRPEVAENYRRSIEQRVQVHSPEVRAKISARLKESRAAKRVLLGLPTAEEQDLQKEEARLEREKERAREKAERVEAKKLMAENLRAQKAALNHISNEPKKRTSNTPDHRRAISEAIRAKWQDPEYRALAVRRMKEVKSEKAAAQGPPPPSRRSPKKSMDQSSTSSVKLDAATKKNQEMLQQIQGIVSQLLASRRLLSSMDVKIVEMQGQADAFLNDPIMNTRLANLLEEIQMRRTELLVSVEGLERKIPEGITFDEAGRVSAPFAIKMDNRGSQEHTSSGRASRRTSQDSSPSSSSPITPAQNKRAGKTDGNDVKGPEGEPLRNRRGEARKSKAWGQS